VAVSFGECTRQKNRIDERKKKQNLSVGANKTAGEQAKRVCLVLSLPGSLNVDDIAML
jgi:hypothetical protein